MRAPRLNAPLILEEPQRESDGMGGHRVVWRPLSRLWAEMRSTSGRQGGAEVGAESVIGWRIKLRAVPVGDARRPCPSQRLRMGSRHFLIDAVAESDPEGRWLTCFAREEEQA